MIEILDCPMPVTVQDGGRPGYRHIGVPLSGALDPEWLAIANALVGNPASTAALEMRLLGLRLRAMAPLTVALAGACTAQIEDNSGELRHAAAWRSHALERGETLNVGRLHDGIAYLAFAGGLDVPEVLGSRSTYVRAGIGGLDGRALKAGDSLPVAAVPAPRPLRLPQAPPAAAGPLRIVPGPQREYFTDAAWRRLLDDEFVISREADRMGLRLDGPRLEHTRGADIVSDAVTPGVIQVPGDGRPIILLADCQTVGGYPKIATVIGADLPRLGRALPGQTLRFVEVGIDQALAARRQAANDLAACIAGMVPSGAQLDLIALYHANLIDGVIDARQANQP